MIELSFRIEDSTIEARIAEPETSRHPLIRLINLTSSPDRLAQALGTKENSCHARCQIFAPSLTTATLERSRGFSHYSLKLFNKFITTTRLIGLV